MRTLTLRGVPEDVYRALKERAKRNRRSLNEEVIAVLAGAERTELYRESDERPNKQRVEVMVKLVEKWRDRLPATMTAKEIDAAIEEGRA